MYTSHITKENMTHSNFLSEINNGTMTHNTFKFDIFNTHKNQEIKRLESGHIFITLPHPVFLVIQV